MALKRRLFAFAGLLVTPVATFIDTITQCVNGYTSGFERASHCRVEASAFEGMFWATAAFFIASVQTIVETVTYLLFHHCACWCHTCKIAHDSENIATTVSCEVYSESFYGITKYKVSEFYWKFCALVEECNSH